VLLHARKALLKLDPRANRRIPPLDYARVYRVKHDFPELCIVLNGGVGSLDEGLAHLAQVDGVMLGRAAYDRPGLLREVDTRLFASSAAPGLLDPESVIEAFLPYLAAEVERGTPLKAITRHLCGLFHGRPGAREWRRLLAGDGCGMDGLRALRSALAQRRTAGMTAATA
jgi:tRNA-dihydrouridine synthase A